MDFSNVCLSRNLPLQFFIENQFFIIPPIIHLQSVVIRWHAKNQQSFIFAGNNLRLFIVVAPAHHVNVSHNIFTRVTFTDSQRPDVWAFHNGNYDFTCTVLWIFIFYLYSFHAGIGGSSQRRFVVVASPVSHEFVVKFLKGTRCKLKCYCSCCMRRVFKMFNPVCDC